MIATYNSREQSRRGPLFKARPTVWANADRLQIHYLIQYKRRVQRPQRHEQQEGAA